MRKKIAVFIILCSSYFLWTAVPVQAKTGPDPTEKELAAEYEKSLKLVDLAETNGVKLNPKLKEAVLQVAKK